MEVFITFVVLLVIAIGSLFVKRDPSKWYGDMLCLDCAYRWVSRKTSRPARCPNCGRRNLHAVTLNRPRPIIESLTGTPGLLQSQEIAYASPKQNVLSHHEEYREHHKRLEQILKNSDVSLEQKAFYVVSLTRNADAISLMHRLKVTEQEAETLLQHLEHAGYVSDPDETGERVVLAQT